MIRFALLVLALSIPFWLVGAATGWQLFEGLPVAALMAICPLAAAALLTRKDCGNAAAGALLERAIDYPKIKPIWYVPILLLKPAIMVLSYEVMRLRGLSVPTPQFSLLAAIVMLAAFLVAAVGEEVGWSGYALDRLQRHRSAVHAAIILGMTWALWHVVPMVQSHRSAAWIAWHGLETVATRMLMVWIYNSTGNSVFAASLFHAVDNVSWLSFPEFGSYYDPRVTAPLTIAAAAIVAILWRPRTRARAPRPSPAVLS